MRNLTNIPYLDCGVSRTAMPIPVYSGGSKGGEGVRGRQTLAGGKILKANFTYYILGVVERQ